MLIIDVSEIKGKCPVYKVGDKIVIDGPKIVLEKTDAICIPALAAFTSLCRCVKGWCGPEKAWIVKRKGCCLHPMR